MKETLLIIFFAFIGITTNVVYAQTSGICGDDLTWQLTGSGNELTLTINGSGEMYDYTRYYDSRPWDSYKNNIKTIIINRGVSVIGECAFYQSFNLEYVTIPNTVTKLGNNSFFACNSLATLTIPNSVTVIGSSVFEACSSLTSITVDTDNLNYSSNNGVLYNKLQDTLIYCPAGKEGIFTVPNSVTDIAEKAFQNCRKLTSITVPNSVLTIGSSAFSICTSLVSINIDANNLNYSSSDGIFYNKLQDTLLCCPSGKTGVIIIPNTVITISDDAFNFCRELTSIIIPNSVITIGKGVFEHCYGLTSVEIGNSVESIGDFAFCWSGLTSITIPNSVKSIGRYIFSDCSNLESAIIGNSVMAMKEGAFSSCSRLTSVEIGNSVVEIGYTAFYECYRLNTLIMGESVATIGDGAFAYCVSLNSITCKTITPPEIYYNTFYYVPINAQVFIPCNTSLSYQNSDWGSIFTNFIEDCNTGLNENVLNRGIIIYPNPANDKIFVGCEDFSSIKIYDISGKEVLIQNANGRTEFNISNLPKGVYIVNILLADKIIGNGKIVKK